MKKKINDTKLYLYFGIVTFVIALILTSLSLYSKLVVESEASDLLAMTENVNENFSKAYVLLREPYIFSRYQHFDSADDLRSIFKRSIDVGVESKESLMEVMNNTYPGVAVKEQLKRLDAKIKAKEELHLNEKQYIESLLDRREKGSRLSLYTAVFIYAVSFLSFIFFFYEKKSIAKE